MVAWRRWSSLLMFWLGVSCGSEAAQAPREQPQHVPDHALPTPDAGLSVVAPSVPAEQVQDASASIDAGSGVDAAGIEAVQPRLPPNYSRPALCDRPGRDDLVRDLFCDDPYRVASLADLYSGLGLTEPDVAGTIYGGAVVVSHSTALSGDVVSEINPRVIIISAQMFLAFSRGIQQVEIAASDRGADPRLNFYLVTFRQACNLTADGCRPGDLYTPRIEADWQSLTLQDDEDLKNSASDCRQCHQRGTERPVPLMRELDGPWTHFFGPDQEEPEGFPEVTGTGLLRDYLRAKGDERYANLSAAVMRSTVGFSLQRAVPTPQPLLFDGNVIMNERWPWTEATGYKDVPEKSTTWYTAYEAFKRGEQLPMPYFEPRVSDLAKQAKLTEAYQRYRNGELTAEELPDFGDIFPDEPQIRAEIGLQTEPGATPAELLIQACASCHNDVLDQTISRARFNVALGRMSREEIQLAIARLEAPRTAPGAMPPPGRRQIPAPDLRKLIDYLKAQTRSTEDDTLLERVAQSGMAGPKR